MDFHFSSFTGIPVYNKHKCRVYLLTISSKLPAKFLYNMSTFSTSIVDTHLFIQCVTSYLDKLVD